MSDQRIPISQLSETQTAPDASYIAIDDGSLTKKITVENFNSTSTASAQQYASQAAASAQTVEDNIATSAAQIREATLAAREATQASTAATASATSAYDSASLAQNYSVNAATSAGQAMSAADTASQAITESRSHAQDSEAWAVGKRNGADVPSSDDTYHNNAKYYSDNALSSAIRAENAANSINNPDPTLTIEGVAADSKATGKQIDILKGFMVISDPTYIGTDVSSWAQGTLRETNGGPVDSSIRCRTGMYIRPKRAQGNLCTISVKDGFKASYRAYTTNATKGYDASESIVYYFTGTKDIQIKPTYYYRFIISKTDDTDLTPAEVPSDALAIAYYEQINTTLQAEVNEALSKIYNNAYDPGYSIIVGGINTSGGNMSTETRARTQYIKIVPGVSYFLELTNTDYGLVGAYVYGSVAQTSVIRRLTFLDSQHLFFTAEEGENYFRTAFYHVMSPDAQTFTAEEAAGLKDYVSLRTTSSSKYLEKTGTFEFFTVIVDRPLSYGGTEVTDASKQEEVECVLRLPDSYSPVGTPTRLVLACHGASGYVDAANNYWYSNNGWPPFMDSLLAAGYAVFDSNVLPTSTGTELMGRAMGSPAYVNVLKKAYDYIQSNYNVYPEIFAHGTSMGGLGASAFSKAYPELVLAESSFAGRDMSQYINWMRTGEYDADDDMAKVWGYDTIAALKADKWSHIEGCAPVMSLHKLTNGVLEYPPDRATDFDNWLAYYSSVDLLGRNDAIGEVTAIRPPVPYKTWDSWADNANHTKAKFVLQKAFRANGFIYEVVAYDSYSHDQMCYGKVEDMRNQLIAWYKRWE